MNAGPTPESYRSNAGAQFVKGFTQLLQGAALPLVVAQFVAGGQFQAWALAWGLALLAGYLDFGLQTGVAGLTARLLAAGEPLAARRHAQAALLVAGALALCTLAVSVVVAWQVAAIFPDLEPGLRREVQFCIPLLVAAQLLNIQAGVVFNYFAGAQRTTMTARLLTWWRLATLCAIVVGGITGATAVGLSLLLLIGNAFGAVAMAHRLWFDLHGHEAVGASGAASRTDTPLLRAGREVLRSTGALAFWSLAMLCVTGLDLVVVGRVDFVQVGAYAIAASLTAGLTGMVNALQTPMMPRLAALQDRSGMLIRLSWISRLNSASVFALASVVMLASSTGLIGLFGPRSERAMTAELTVVLTAAVSLRLLGGPLAWALIAAGASNRVFMPQLIEAVVNLAASLTLGVMYGAVGVALGTVIGAIAGLLGMLFGSIPRCFGPESFRALGAALLWEPIRSVGPLVAVSVAHCCGVGWLPTGVVLVIVLTWLARTGRGLVRQPLNAAPAVAAQARPAALANGERVASEGVL